jgi:hypothetical protein
LAERHRIVIIVSRRACRQNSEQQQRDVANGA